MDPRGRQGMRFPSNAEICMAIVVVTIGNYQVFTEEIETTGRIYCPVDLFILVLSLLLYLNLLYMPNIKPNDIFHC